STARRRTTRTGIRSRAASRTARRSPRPRCANCGRRPVWRPPSGRSTPRSTMRASTSRHSSSTCHPIGSRPSTGSTTSTAGCRARKRPSSSSGPSRPHSCGACRDRALALQRGPLTRTVPAARREGVGHRRTAQLAVLVPARLPTRVLLGRRSDHGRRRRALARRRPRPARGGDRDELARAPALGRALRLPHATRAVRRRRGRPLLHRVDAGGCDRARRARRPARPPRRGRERAAHHALSLPTLGPGDRDDARLQRHPAEKCGSAVKILIAEDETIIRLDLRDLLERAGFEVCAEAKNGEEAIELARSEEPDLAVLDVKMPKLDGIEAARRILEERPIPIVMLTAYGQDELVTRAVDVGVFGYLVKPFREQDLLPAIRTALARHAERAPAPPPRTPVRLDVNLPSSAGSPWPLRIELAAEAERVRDAIAVELIAPTWWDEAHGEEHEFLVAYFSAEFGIDESLPIYSGGLGVLAGDHLKSASELGVPLVGVGLLYRHG